MSRQNNHPYTRADRLRLDVWISSNETKLKAYAEVERVGWKSFADYIRAIVWLASQGIILVRSPDVSVPKKPKKKYKRKKVEKITRKKEGPRVSDPNFEFIEATRRWKKKPPATVHVLNLD